MLAEVLVSAASRAECYTDDEVIPKRSIQAAGQVDAVRLERRGGFILGKRIAAGEPYAKRHVSVVASGQTTA